MKEVFEAEAALEPEPDHPPGERWSLVTSALAVIAAALLCWGVFIGVASLVR